MSSSITSTTHTGAVSNLVEANKTQFDGMAAANFNSRPDVAEMNRRVADGMKKMYGKFDPKTTEVLDFACGTGQLSRFLAPYCKSALGVDISQGMVDVYNEEAAKPGTQPGKVHAVVKTLTGVPDELGGRKFDVIVCSMAYHHLESISATTHALISHLHPGGTILIVDFHQLDTHSPVAAGLKSIESVNQHHAHGFTEDDIRRLFVDEMGLTGFQREVFCHAYITSDLTFAFPDGEGEEADRRAQEEAKNKGKAPVEHHGHRHGHGHHHGGHGHETGSEQTVSGTKVEFFIAMGTKAV